MNKLAVLLLFAICFGFIEGSTSIYLRPLISGQNSSFEVSMVRADKLSETGAKAVSVEKWREFFKLIMIAAAAALCSASLLYWLGYSVFIFAVSTLAAYFWIWLKTGWPASLLNWDILFHMPVLMIAPAIVPVIISIIGLLISLMLISILDRFRTPGFELYHWIPLLLAQILWLISFVSKTSSGMENFPASYSWSLFIIGIVFAAGSGVMIYKDFFISRKKWIFK
jgi:hypothetical protein